MDACGPAVAASGWFHVLTTEPQVAGIVTWIGLLATIAGLGIALVQLQKVRTSSEAASDAVAKLVNVVRSHELNIHLTSAYGHLTSAQTMIKQSKSDVAAAYLSVGWRALMSARELSDDVDDRQSVGDLVVATRRLFDDVDAPSVRLSSWISARRNADINKILNDLGTLTARLNAALSGIGSAS